MDFLSGKWISDKSDESEESKLFAKMHLPKVPDAHRKYELLC